MSKVTPFLMFNDQLEAAIEFYATTFPDSEIRNVARTVKDGPITSAEFVIGGQAFKGYNGGPYFTFSDTDDARPRSPYHLRWPASRASVVCVHA